MASTDLTTAKQSLVRDRVLQGAADVLTEGGALTFAKVAETAGVPERTVYRHFASREALLSELFVWANERVGLAAPRAETKADLLEAVPVAFAGFDDLAPVVRALLAAPDGLWVRLSDNDDRRRAATAVVRDAAPDLDPTVERRVASTVQLLSSAAAWQHLHDYWDLDGDEAAATVTFALDLLLEAVAARSRTTAR